MNKSSEAAKRRDEVPRQLGGHEEADKAARLREQDTERTPILRQQQKLQKQQHSEAAQEPIAE